MAAHSVEVSINGRWQTVPALDVNDRTIVIRGKWVRLAVIEGEEWLDELEDPESCVEHVRAQTQLKADLFTFAQKLPTTRPKYGYAMEMESIAAARVTNFRAWWDRLPQESRKNVRRSQKRGVVVDVRKLDDHLISDIVAVNNDSAIRQGVPFVHHGKTCEQVERDQQSFLDRSEFVCAYLGTEMIGFLKVVYGREVASLLQILPKASRQEFRPANALLAKVVERCADKGLAYLTYGRYSYGRRGTTSLMEFKARNGFEELFVPRYYIPLTLRGKVSLHLGRHPRPEHLSRASLLPESVVRVAIRLRSKWYARKLFVGPV